MLHKKEHKLTSSTADNNLSLLPLSSLSLSVPLQYQWRGCICWAFCPWNFRLFSTVFRNHGENRGTTCSKCNEPNGIWAHCIGDYSHTIHQESRLCPREDAALITLRSFTSLWTLKHSENNDQNFRIRLLGMQRHALWPRERPDRKRCSRMSRCWTVLRETQELKP